MQNLANESLNDTLADKINNYFGVCGRTPIFAYFDCRIA